MTVRRASSLAAAPLRTTLTIRVRPERRVGCGRRGVVLGAKAPAVACGPFLRRHMTDAGAVPDTEDPCGRRGHVRIEIGELPGLQFPCHRAFKPAKYG